MSIVDSGNRREFETGAVRDVAEGKGRCDLLPLDIIADMSEDPVMEQIGAFVRSGSNEHLYNALHRYALINDECMDTILLEVAIHFEEGCRKYGERNWEKGIPLHCFIDSAARHYLKMLRGDTDERHDRAFVWNILCAAWTNKHHPGLNDLPLDQVKVDGATEGTGTFFCNSEDMTNIDFLRSAPLEAVAFCLTEQFCGNASKLEFAQAYKATKDWLRSEVWFKSAEPVLGSDVNPHE